MPLRHGEGVDKTSLPADWITSVWPKQRELMPARLEEIKLVQVGFVLLPEHFAWSLELPDKDAPEGDTRGLIITFHATPEGLEIMLIHGVNVDLEHWLKRVTDKVPMSDWKSLATEEMVQWLASDYVRSRVPQLANADERAAVNLTKDPDSPKRTRHRITEQHLKEVTRIYTEATEQGEAPTRAVAEHFDVAHSTAAKWVGTARRNGLLEGVAQKWGTK